MIMKNFDPKKLIGKEVIIRKKLKGVVLESRITHTLIGRKVHTTVEYIVKIDDKLFLTKNIIDVIN